MIYLRALLGILFFIAMAWVLSSDRKRFQWRVVAGGILLQLAIAWFILQTSSGRSFFDGIGSVVSKLVSLTEPGAKMVFGSLGDSGGAAGFIFAFAGTGLVVIIFFSALMSVFYHLGIMQVAVWALAKVMSATMGLSGGESMAAAANIFMGQTEAPLVIKPYVPKMTMSELNALMTGGFATIAGSVMAVYMKVLGPDYAAHLVTASVMSAPASFVIAKLIRPETQVSETAGKVELKIERNAGNVIEAAANGTSDGLRLWLNVIAMLIAFVALVGFVNWPLGWLGDVLHVDGGLSLARIFGWVFAPVAWLIGVNGWHDCQLFGGLLGTMVSTNEFVAYTQLQTLEPATGNAIVFESARSAQMAVYALCGFANLASIGIQIGGISALAPERKADLSKLALKAMIGGAFACWMTATVAGLFLGA
ncbi:MAG: nucleoside transporter C-terminal domain-containing protein [Planctomycetota bacterium]